jgi:hypothetical protein
MLGSSLIGRVADFESVGWWFESTLPSQQHLGVAQPVKSARLGSERSKVQILSPRPEINRSIAQSGSATVLGTVGRGFESFYSDQFKLFDLDTA